MKTEGSDKVDSLPSMLRPIALLAALAVLPAAAEDKPASGALENVTVNQAQGEIAPQLYDQRFKSQIRFGFAIVP